MEVAGTPLEQQEPHGNNSDLLEATGTPGSIRDPLEVAKTSWKQDGLPRSGRDPLETIPTPLKGQGTPWKQQLSGKAGINFCGSSSKIKFWHFLELFGYYLSGLAPFWKFFLQN